MFDIILVRYGDMTLKGKNKKKFIDKTIATIQNRLNNQALIFERQHDRLYIHLNQEPYAPIIDALKTISGITSFSLVVSSKKDLISIQSVAEQLVQSSIEGDKKLQVNVKRIDKSYPISSMEIAKKVASHLLKTFSSLSVDLSQPDLIVFVEVRKDKAYLYLNKISGLGGFPVGVLGKSLCLLSGGIDSPVAAYLMMKKGVQIEALHFESTPLTSIESVQKVIDLTKKLSIFAEKQTIKLHLIPFKAIHTQILQMVPEPYHITIMRRMMIRLADRIAETDHTAAMVTGDSIGQVASQTLESMHTINAVTTRTILRPLATMDKHEIIDISKTIGCYDISIRPFEDCCNIYLPNQPSTRPRDYYAKRYERLFDYEALIHQCIANIKTIQIHPNSHINFINLGLTVEEAFKSYQDKLNKEVIK